MPGVREHTDGRCKIGFDALVEVLTAHACHVRREDTTFVCSNEVPGAPNEGLPGISYLGWRLRCQPVNFDDGYPFRTEGDMIVPASPFRLERQMVRPFVRALPTALGLHRGSRYSLVRETLLGNVIPDLLVGLWHVPRRPVRRGPFTRLQSHVLALLEQNGAQSLEQVANYLWLKHPVAERALRNLERAGAVVRSEDAFDIDAHCTTASVEMVAIELKMRDWQCALAQAIAYQEFADRSYVVLDGNQIRRLDTIHGEFTSAGVGLILQFGGVARKVLGSATNCVTSPDRVQAMDKLLETRSKRVIGR